MSNHDLTATSEAFEGPVRTCIGCRARDEQRNLLRIARTPVTSATEQAETPPYQPIRRELCPDEALGSIRAKSA